MTPEKQTKMLSSWKGIMEVLQKEMITAEDFTKAFAVVVQLIKELKSMNLQEFSSMKKEMTALSDKLISDFESVIADTRKTNETTFQKIKERSMESINTMFRKMDVQGVMDRMRAEHNEMMQEMPDTEKMMMEMLVKVPTETGETIVDKINETDGKIDKERIEGLEDEIKALKKEIATKSSGGARRVYQPYVDDFTASTNGSLKVFVLSRAPLRTNTVQVFGTDFPTILRPTTDFTVSGKTLTLTSAVPAPSVGATLLAHYFA